MTNEERDLIASFVERVGGTPSQGVPGGGQGTVAPLPPVDREADALIGDLFNRYPEARYRVTQMAFLQEHALVEAQNRIARLQWELQRAQAAQPAPAQGSPWGAAAAGAAAAQPRGVFSSLFGGGNRPAAPPPPQYPPQYPSSPQYPPQSGPQYAAPPPPVYPPGYNPGLFQQQGTGFFGSALRTAAGVAGGVLAADALMSLFSPHQAFGGGLGGGFGSPGLFGSGAGPGLVENVTNNNAGNPWGAGTDPMDQGGAPKDDAGNVDQSAWNPAPAPDQGGWQQADAGDGGWQDAPADPASDWQDASSDTGDSGWTDSGSDSSSDV